LKIVFESHRILAYAQGRSNVSGGAERQQWLLARALARRGHEVVVYTLADADAPEQLVEGVRFRWMTPARPLLAWAKILRKEQPDWWYRRCADHYLGLLAPLVRFSRSRLAYACAFDSDCAPRRTYMRRRYLWPLYALGLRMADRILVQHTGQLEILAPPLRANAHLVPSIAGEGHARAMTEGYVAWVGLLREPKNPHLVADIAELLPDVRFVVCGFTTLHRTAPEYARTIEERLRSKPNIDFRGRVAPSEAQEIIGRAAVLLSTSSEEGFPNTFLQAWSSGVPVVSLGLDPGAVIRTHDAGRVVDGVDEAARTIAQLLDDHALNDVLGRNGRIYVLESHTEEAAVERLERALTSGQGRP
jgi:glycosyltransferase involved in cell wall biosynthesis